MIAARSPRSLARAALAGLLATAAMDAGARRLVAPALGIAPLGPEGLGRWIGHMRHGQFTHASIAAAPAVPNEAAIGVACHYAIGASLGVGYELLRGVSGDRAASLPLATAYGTATTAFSWLLMFPATGQGLLGRRQSPRLATLSLCNHIVYGLGVGAANRLLTHSRSRLGTRKPCFQGFLRWAVLSASGDSPLIADGARTR